MADDPSPFEAELRAHLGMQAADQADLHAVVLAVHRVTCPEMPCRHRLDDVNDVDRQRAQAALLALGRYAAAGYSAPSPRGIAELYAAGRITHAQMLDELMRFPYDQAAHNELQQAHTDRLITAEDLAAVLRD